MNNQDFKIKFAYMFEDETGMEPVTLFGFETDRGWNNLLLYLFLIISIIDTNKYIRVRQVKQKFGGLRFYIDWTGPQRKPTLHDHFVDLVMKLPRFIRRILYNLGFNPFKKWDPVHKEIQNIISHFEMAAEFICEDCGKLGHKRHGPWIYTLCDKCFAKRKSMDAVEEILRNENLLNSGHLQPQDL